MDDLFAMYGVAMWEGYPQFDLYDGELTYSAVTPKYERCTGMDIGIVSGRFN